jgi:hypothetical protein
MIRKILGAACVLTLSLGMVVAEEFKGSITKIDKKGVTLVTKDSKEGKTFEFDEKFSVSKMVKKTKEEVTGGHEAEVFKDLPKKGIAATVITNEKGKVTEIIVGGKKKAKE